MKKRVALIVLPLMVSVALAQDIDLPPEEPEIRRYTVEMIVFSYAQGASGTAEVFLPDEPPPMEELVEIDLLEHVRQYEADLVDYPDGADGVTTGDLIDGEFPDDEALAEEFDPYELIMLPEEEFLLLDVAERLERLDAYSVLAHFGWTQPTFAAEDTEALLLDSLVIPPEGLEGDFSLYLGRYLHLAVNLQLQAAEPVDSLGTENPNDDWYLYPDPYDDDVVSYPIHYRINEDRIFRNGDLRYFDHPKFGVLAKITRDEWDSKEEPDEEELLGEPDLIPVGGE